MTSQPDVWKLVEQVSVQPGSIVSRKLVETPHGRVVLFAFDAGEALSEHTSPYTALVTVLEGEARITVGGREAVVGAGEACLLPAQVPHAVKARTALKMMLVMLQ